MVLPKSAFLCSRYAIQGILGEAGPFEITYLAWDTQTEQEVVIREFFPVGTVRRSRNGTFIEVVDAKTFEYGISRYGRESELLSEFKNPFVVENKGVFNDNGTIYRVSQHITGVSLSAHVKRHGGRLSEDQACLVMNALLSALKESHEQYLFHGGLSPRSILIDDSQKPQILNFQMALTMLAHRQKNQHEFLTPGFYPAEPLDAEGFVAWDIYSCGAILFYLLTGSPLPERTSKASHIRIGQLIKHQDAFSHSIRQLLLDALAFEPDDRPVSMGQLYNQFLTCITLPPANKRNRSPHPEAIHQQSPPIQKPKIKKLTLDKGAPRVQKRTQRPPSLPSQKRGTSTQLLPSTSNKLVSPHQPDYQTKPSKKEDSRLQDLLYTMVKRQQHLMNILVFILVITSITVVGFLVAPRFLDTSSDQVPQHAAAEISSAEASTSSTPLPSESQLETLPDSMHTANGSPLSQESQNIEFTEDLLATTNPPVEQTDSNVNERPPSNPTNQSFENSTPPVEVVAQDAQDKQEIINDRPRSTPSHAVSQPAQPIEPVLEDVEDTETENQPVVTYQTLLDAGNEHFQQGQLSESLASYEQALQLNPDQPAISNRIEEIRTIIREEERKGAVAESLRVRLANVTDANGIFIAPDTAPVLLNETELFNSVKYPPQARRAGIEGRVVIRLIVNELGQVEDPQVVQGIGFGCDDEVLRILEKARFTPALFNANQVKSWFMYSLVFSLS